MVVFQANLSLWSFSSVWFVIRPHSMWKLDLLASHFSDETWLFFNDSAKMFSFYSRVSLFLKFPPSLCFCAVCLICVCYVFAHATQSSFSGVFLKKHIFSVDLVFYFEPDIIPLLTKQHVQAKLLYNCWLLKRKTMKQTFSLLSLFI